MGKGALRENSQETAAAWPQSEADHSAISLEKHA
jgi:hypothetical protein